MRILGLLCTVWLLGCATDLTEDDFPCSPGYPCASGYECVSGFCQSTGPSSNGLSGGYSQPGARGPQGPRSNPDTVSSSSESPQDKPSGDGDPGGQDGADNNTDDPGDSPGPREDEEDEGEGGADTPAEDSVAEPSSGLLGDSCEKIADCQGEDKAWLCLIMPGGKGICTWECTPSDSDCPEGFYCGTVATFAGNPMYNCLPPEGE